MNSADKILFRCSSLGYLMTDPRSKTETLSETTKTHLIDTFVSAKYGRKEELKNKFLDKGNLREEDSIALLSLINKTFFMKNEESLENDFIKGTPDSFIGNSIHDAEETFDTKTSWSAHTFFRSQKSELDKMYKWQGNGYMWLTGAKKHTVAYCLVNGTPQAIEDEKRRASYQYGIVDQTSRENKGFVERCKQIEINHIFDLKDFRKENPHFEFHSNLKKWNYDIPAEERIFKITFDRNESDLLTLKQRILASRKWMNDFLFKIKPEVIIFVYNAIEAGITPIEKHLKDQEDFPKIQEAKRKAILAEQRLIELQKYDFVDNTGFDLGNMDDAMFHSLLTGLKKTKEDKIAADKKAEEDRAEIKRISDLHSQRKDSILHLWNYAELELKTQNLGELSETDWTNIVMSLNQEKVDADARQGKIRQDNLKLKAIADAKEKELAAEREKTAKEKQIADAKLKSEQVARLKLEAEIKEKADKEDVDLKAKIAAEKKEKRA